MQAGRDVAVLGHDHAGAGAGSVIRLLAEKAVAGDGKHRVDSDYARGGQLDDLRLGQSAGGHERGRRVRDGGARDAVLRAGARRRRRALDGGGRFACAADRLRRDVSARRAAEKGGGEHEDHKRGCADAALFFAAARSILRVIARRIAFVKTLIIHSRFSL